MRVRNGTCVAEFLGSLAVLLAAQTTAAASGSQSTGFEKPAPLIALEASRRAMGSGRIEWSVTPEGDEDSEMRYVSRFARNGDMIFENRGDKEGWTIIDREPRRGISKYRQLYLSNEKGSWYHQETSLGCQLRARDGRPSPWADEIKDIRGAGISPTSWSLKSDVGFRALWDDPSNRITRWESQEVDNLHLVTGHCESGATYNWYINPEKGWNAERTTFEVDGVLVAEAVCSLRQYADVWLPETTDYFRGGRLVETVRIRSAALNTADDPARFTGGDLGLEPGTNISTGVGPVVAWNGEAVSSWESWIADVKTGKRQWGPTFLRRIKGEDYYSPYETESQRRMRSMALAQHRAKSAREQHEGLWEAYVRSFVERYELNEEQTRKAMEILRACRERAEAFLRPRRNDISRLVSELEQAKKAKDVRLAENLEGRLNVLREPVGGIFEQELKPRLEKLPTRAQRKAAAEREKAASQPAGKGAGD